MKKIISIALCLALCILALASCGEKEIGSYRENYDYEPTVIKDITLNLYIVCDKETTQNSMVTIGRELSQYTEDKFHTALNVFYVYEEDYADTIAQKTADGASDKADIILINSQNMMNSLVNDGKLADLTSFFKSKTYGDLNVKIAADILEASKIDDKLFCVPNNHIVGDYNNNGVIGDYGYEYIVIDETIARSLGYGDVNTLSTYTSVEALMAEGQLGEALLNAGKLTYDEENGTFECTCSGEKCVEVVRGGYSDQKKFVENGKYFTITDLPSTTAADAFASAFGVVKGTEDVSRAMEVIYAFNTDTTLRNLLQYGVKGTNYDIDENGIVTRVSPEDPNRANSVYYMNILYTGDLFGAYYCPELGWTKNVSDNGLLQNRKSYVNQEVYQP